MNEQKRWWQQPQRIVQTNLRLIDASLDPEKVAADLAHFGATAMLFNVGGIFAWYPSELELQAANPRLHRDLLGEMIAAAHKHHIKVIGRYDLSKATAKAYEAHPDWFCRGRDGGPFEYNGTYQACVNGGWYQEQAPKLLEESLSRYEIDGLFFNMFGYLATDYSFKSYGLCRCENCRQGFKAFSGHDLPEDTSPGNPVYRQYLRFQDTTSETLRNKIHQIVKGLRPDVGISNMGKKSDFFRGEVNRRLDRPRPEWVYQSGEQARNFRSVGGGTIRYSSALTHFIDFPWRYSAESAPAQVLRLAQQLANGADPHYYVMGTLEQADRKALPAVREVFAFHQKHQALYDDLVSEARIGLYQSNKTARYHPKGSGLSQRAFRGAYRSLVESGLVFDLVSDTRGGDDDFVARHQRYDTMVLPAVACMSDAEAANIDAFVANGGTLLVLGAAGIFDENGAARGKPALTCLPYSTVVRELESTRGGYLLAGRGELPGLDSDRILMDGAYSEVQPKAGVQTSLRLLLPQRFGPPELCFPEPELATDLPGVLIGAGQKGHCIFLPWQPDALYYEHGLLEHRSLIAELAARFTRPPLARLNRPSRMELTVQRHRQTNALLIHVVNYSGQNENVGDEPITAHGLELTLHGVEAGTAHALVADQKLTPSPGGTSEDRVLRLPPIAAFEVIALSA